MMDIGMPLMIEHGSIGDAARLCTGLGLRFVELNMNIPVWAMDDAAARECRRIADGEGIYFTIHVDERLDPADINPLISATYRETMKKALAFAGDIAAPIVNMHMSAGIHITLPDKKVYIYDKYRAGYIAALAKFRDEAAREGVAIAIENSDGFLPFIREGIDTLLKSPAFCLTYDIGHDHAIGGRDEDFILSRLGRLRHMHAHDTRGRDNHLAFGEGDIDLARRLSLARNHGCRVVAEVKTSAALEASVRYLRENGWLA